ncbi:MAG TPA: hypothetical protein VFV11_01985 [Solimonas sp.]|jgi:hypothetical protein|nr:hypothetical protein [Solimonas sp.]
MKTLSAIPQSEHGFLRVQGPDADLFLQGQLSCDLRRLTPEHGLTGSYNTPKGRMLAVMQLLRAPDGAVLIELHRSVLEATLKRLRMFVLRSKLTISDVSAEYAALGLLGPGAPQALAALGLPVPTNPQDAATQPDLIILRRHGEAPRYSLVGAPDRLAVLRAQLPEDVREAGFSHWRAAEIEAGVPVVYAETRERHVPQMANLDLLGGIGFDKGCYTGQEIVARLHYLGQLKRRMYVATLPGPAPQPGEPVQAAGETQAAGEIVDAVDLGDGQARATVVLQIAQRRATLTLNDGRPVTLVSGPEA